MQYYPEENTYARDMFIDHFNDPTQQRRMVDALAERLAAYSL